MLTWQNRAIFQSLIRSTDNIVWHLMNLKYENSYKRKNCHKYEKKISPQNVKRISTPNVKRCYKSEKLHSGKWEIIGITS